MKVPPKRKGNINICYAFILPHAPSMKVPPKRKGNYGGALRVEAGGGGPSMKVPPKRKGNPRSGGMSECLSSGAPQ